MAGYGLVHVVCPLPFVRWGDLHISTHMSDLIIFLQSILLGIAVLHRSMEPESPCCRVVANGFCMGVLSFSGHVALAFACCRSCVCGPAALRILLIFVHVVLHLGRHGHGIHIFLSLSLFVACVLLPVVAWAMLSYRSGLWGIHSICN